MLHILLPAGRLEGSLTFELSNSLRNFPVLRVIPRLRPQPDRSVASWVSLLRGDALKNNPFSLRMDEVLTGHNESVASYAFFSLFESRGCGNPERVITITSFENIVARLGFVPFAKRV